MAETHVVSALRAKRAEISTYIHGLEKKVDAWRARLAHIDDAIRIFSPETDPEATPPRRTYRRSGYFKRGELARQCSDELRKADGKPLTTAAIASSILDAKALPRDPDLMASVSDRVQGLLRERMKRGQVLRQAKLATLNGRSHLRSCDATGGIASGRTVAFGDSLRLREAAQARYYEGVARKTHLENPIKTTIFTLCSRPAIHPSYTP
jgi:hypothetical protein